MSVLYCGTSHIIKRDWYDVPEENLARIPDSISTERELPRDIRNFILLPLLFRRLRHHQLTIHPTFRVQNTHTPAPRVPESTQRRGRHTRDVPPTPPVHTADHSPHLPIPHPPT